jgi:hypothetical protein
MPSHTPDERLLHLRRIGFGLQGDRGGLVAPKVSPAFSQLETARAVARKAERESGPQAALNIGYLMGQPKMNAPGGLMHRPGVAEGLQALQMGQTVPQMRQFDEAQRFSEAQRGLLGGQAAEAHGRGAAAAAQGQWEGLRTAGGFAQALGTGIGNWLQGKGAAEMPRTMVTQEEVRAKGVVDKTTIEAQQAKDTATATAATAAANRDTLHKQAMEIQALKNSGDLATAQAKQQEYRMSDALMAEILQYGSKAAKAAADKKVLKDLEAPTAPQSAPPLGQPGAAPAGAGAARSKQYNNPDGSVAGYQLSDGSYVDANGTPIQAKGAAD